MAGESRLLGLFTTKAYAEPASETPVLHRKLQRVLDDEDLIEGSHDYKAAVALFDTFPKDELFAAPVEDLRRVVVALLGARGHRPRPPARPPRAGRPQRLVRARAPARPLRPGAGGARARAVPRALRDRPTPRPRTCSTRASAPACTSSCTAPTGCPSATTASSRPRSCSSRARGTTSCATCSTTAAAGRRLAAASPRALQGLHDAGHAPTTSDLRVLAGTERRTFTVSLQPLPGNTRIAFYKRGAKVELGGALPMLEDLGLRVIEEISTRLVDADETWVQEFRVLGPDGDAARPRRGRRPRGRDARRRPRAARRSPTR